MIKIDRPNNVPATLAEKGATETQRLRQRWDEGERKFSSEEFKATVYSHSSVRDALAPGNRPKCWYCESEYDHVAAGQVDHYRPKTSVTYTGIKKDEVSGYYWLAYDWNNLLMICPRCNGKFKKTCFPLLEGSPRARSHHDSTADELPLLLDPSSVDPADHIEWHEDIPAARNNSPIGRTTIDLLKLACRISRPSLCDRRLERYKSVWRAWQRASAANATPEDKAELNEFLDLRSEFSAMCRAAVASWESGQQPTIWL